MCYGKKFLHFGVALAKYDFIMSVNHKFIQGNCTMNENTIIEEKPIELTAGEILRNARTTGRRKREISTVAKQLCIREEFLTALEEGDYSVIPEVVYILGFARNYAMELGLNPDEIVAKIKCEMGLVPDCAPSSDKENEINSTTSGEKKINMDVIKITFMNVLKFVCAKWVWFVTGLVALIVIVVASVMIFGGDDATSVVDENAPVVAAERNSDPKFAMTVRERFGTKNRDDADIIIQAIGESWVQIKDGRGNTEFSRVLMPGEVYYLPPKGRFRGSFGNAGAVDVWVNGELAPKLGGNQVRKLDVEMTADALMGK